jgi:hypothetical protein
MLLWKPRQGGLTGKAFQVWRRRWQGSLAPNLWPLFGGNILGGTSIQNLFNLNFTYQRKHQVWHYMGDKLCRNGLLIFKVIHDCCFRFHFPVPKHWYPSSISDCKLLRARDWPIPLFPWHEIWLWNALVFPNRRHNCRDNGHYLYHIANHNWVSHDA